MIDKQKLIQAIAAHLEQEAAGIEASAKAAYAAAVDSENVPENKYDVRSLMASYLAEAQATRLAAIKKALGLFRNLKPRSFDDDQPIVLGALVTLEDPDGHAKQYFLGPEGAGIKVQLDQQTIQVVTTKAPLGKALVGLVCGDEVTLKRDTQAREITAVQ